MLTITVGEREMFNNETQEFFTEPGTLVTFEHSLISVSKWESIFKVPFLAPGDKPAEQILAYIQLMIVSPNIPSKVIETLTQKDLDRITDYIGSSETATTFPDNGRPKSRRRPVETITSELIYYWMIMHNIPFECQTWHLNRLLTLIQVCNVKNSKPEKLSKSEIAARNRELNARRKAQMNTTG